ncbi:sialidase family protein [Streptomyces mirabilis]
MAIDEVAPAEGAVRLREMLRGTATASESRFMRGLRQGQEQGVLVGAALHAAERSRQGKAPTDLERVLLKALGDLMPQADVHACGQEYRSAVADLGSLDIVPASVTSRPLTSGYTLADFKERLPVIGREAVTLANGAIVDPAVLAAGQPIDTDEFTGGIRDFGYGATVFSRPPQPPEERDKPVPGYRAKVEFDSFYVRRAVGDQWGGKDEIYWTVAAASDKHKAPTYKSGTFGSIKQGDTRPFTGAGRVVFDGQAGTHLGLHIAAWEADQSSSEWYDKLFEVLQEVVDGLAIFELLNNFNFTPSGDILGYALEITKLFIFLKEYLRNKDDLSCERMFFFDRHTLVTLFNRGQDTWEFNGEGHHSLRIRYTGERPVFPSGALEYVTLSGSGIAATVSAPVALGWTSASPPALASYNGKLHAAYIRPGDRAVMWSVLENGTWSEPVQIVYYGSDYAPALAVFKNKLYMAHTGMDGALYVCSYAGSGPWDGLTKVPDVHTERAPSLTVNGPNVPIIGERLVVAHRTGSGDASTHYSRDGGDDWRVLGSPRGRWSKADGPFSIAGFNDRIWYACRTANSHNHAGWMLVEGAHYGELAPPSNWLTPDSPTITVHDGKLWLAARGNDSNLWLLHTTGDTWQSAPGIPASAMEGEPALASHNGKLHVMYRR